MDVGSLVPFTGPSVIAFPAESASLIELTETSGFSANQSRIVAGDVATVESTPGTAFTSRHDCDRLDAGLLGRRR